MTHPLSRRSFLGLPLAGLAAPILGLGAPVLARADAPRADKPSDSTRAYEADVGVLFNMLTFALKGHVTEEIDRAAGHYRVTMTGQGTGVTARTESTGIIRDGRFKPTALSSVHVVRGRENRTWLTYDYARGLVEYHSVSYTLLLGRRRQADDVVRLVPEQPVDDLFSAELNFAADKLERDADGAHRITVVRRARPVNEGPDDVSPDGYRAELATLRFHAAPEVATGRLTARVDLTGFSSWARPTQPARVGFDAERHLETVDSSLMLGTTFTLRLAPRT